MMMPKRCPILRRFMRSKRGIQAYNQFLVAVRFIVAAFVLMACAFLLNLFINYRFNVTDVQAEVLINGLIYGTGGITYVDPVTGRIYPEIVSISQLSDKELDLGMYYPENNLISAKVTVESTDGDEVYGEVYYNKHWFENWEPLLPWENLPGIGGVKSYEKRLPIMILEDDFSLRMAAVRFLVVQPKSARSRSED